MRTKRWMALALAAVAAAALVWVIARSRRSAAGAPSARGPDAQVRAAAVTVASAEQRDVPIYLDGIGSVAAFKTVTVKTQLDGRLDQVLFREGQPVRRGQVLAQIDPRPFQIQLEQAQGALHRDQAQLENARLVVERDRRLVAQKLIAQQQLDTDVAAAGQLEGAVQVDRAAIASAQLNLEYARITSPIDGVTGIRQVDPGNVVHPSDPGGIVIVTQIDPVAVLFTLPQDDLTPVAQELGRSGTLSVEVYARDGATLLGSGELGLIDNQINQATSTIRLKAVVPNPRHLLWPNQFVNARLRLTTRRDALVVPAVALQRGPAGAFVYVVGGDMTVSMRPVQVDLTQGEVAILAGGLRPGDRVVTDGQNQLRPGARVAPRQAPGGKNGLARVASDGGPPAASGNP